MTTAVQAAPTPGSMRHIPVWNFFGPILKLRHGDFSDLIAIANQNDDAFFTWAGPQKVVFLNDPELVEALLVKQHKDFHKDPGFAALRRLLGNGLLTSEDEFHLKQRRMAQPAFHKKRIDAYGDTMVRYSREADADWRDGETRDVHRDMMAVTLKIIAKTIFSSDVESETEKVANALDTVTQYHERYLNEFVGRIFDMLPIESSRRIKTAEAELNAIIYGFIEAHRAS